MKYMKKQIMWMVLVLLMQVLQWLGMFLSGKVDRRRA